MTYGWPIGSCVEAEYLGGEMLNRQEALPLRREEEGDAAPSPRILHYLLQKRRQGEERRRRGNKEKGRGDMETGRRKEEEVRRKQADQEIMRRGEKQMR